jgi:hypothetical protein
MKMILNDESERAKKKKKKKNYEWSVIFLETSTVALTLSLPLQTTHHVTHFAYINGKYKTRVSK